MRHWQDDVFVGIRYEHPLQLPHHPLPYGLGPTVDTERSCRDCDTPITSKYLEDLCLMCLWQRERRTANPSPEADMVVAVHRMHREMKRALRKAEAQRAAN